MSIVNEIADAMQAVMTQEADRLARQTGFINRQRRLSGSQFVQTLVYGWLAAGDARLETLSQSAANVGVTISRQGLNQRFTPQAATFLEAVLAKSIEQVIAARPVATPLLRRFSCVHVIDSTVIELPDVLAPVWRGCNGSAVKISVCWNLLNGQLVAVHLHDGADHDQQAPMQHEAVAANGIRLADLGYFNLNVTT